MSVAVILTMTRVVVAGTFVNDTTHEPLPESFSEVVIVVGDCRFGGVM